MANAAATLPMVETQWLFSREDLAQTPSVTGISEAPAARSSASPLQQRGEDIRVGVHAGRDVGDRTRQAGDRQVVGVVDDR